MKEETLEMSFTEIETPTVDQPENTHLLQVVKNSGLNEEKSIILLGKFEEYTKVVDEWKLKSKELVITNIEQVTEMKMCREAYKLIKGKVVDIEKTRKSLKEDSLKEGRAIDEVAKELKNLLEPLRDELKEKSEFADRVEASRIEQLKTNRLALLEPFGTDTTFIPLGDLGEEDFQVLLKKEKEFFNFQKEQAEKAEQERVAAEKKLQEEIDERNRIDNLTKERSRFIIASNLSGYLQTGDKNYGSYPDKEWNAELVKARGLKAKDDAEKERIRKENEQLRKEAEEKEKALRLERLKAESERKAIEERAEADRKAREIEAEKLRKQQREMIRKQEEENEAKLKTEREAREKLEREIADKKQKDEVEQRRLADETKQKVDAEKKALKAPDKDKLVVLSKQIEAIVIPVMKTEDGQKVADEISTKRQLFAQWIIKQTETL